MDFLDLSFQVKNQCKSFMKTILYFCICICLTTQAFDVKIQSQKKLSPLLETKISEKYGKLKKLNVKQIEVQILQYWEDDFVIQNHVLCNSGFAFISGARSSNIDDLCDIGITKVERCIQKNKENPQPIDLNQFWYLDF